GAELLLALVERRDAHTAVRLPLLGRMDDPVRLVEALRGAPLDVLGRALLGIEAGDVGRLQVDLGLAVHHPLGHRLADAWAFLDPHGGGRPQPLYLGRLAEE